MKIEKINQRQFLQFTVSSIGGIKIK